MLDKNFRAKCLHPLSQSLPVNTLCKTLKSYIKQNAYLTMQKISKKYENILEPYHSINHDKSKELKLNDDKKIINENKIYIDNAKLSQDEIDRFINVFKKI